MLQFKRFNQVQTCWPCHGCMS